MLDITAKEQIAFIYLKNRSVATPVADLEFFDRDEIACTYSNEYRSNADAVSIDPINIPININTHLLKNGHFGVLRDSAPDLWGQILLAKFLDKSIRDLTIYDLLSSENSCRIGNLDFRNSEDMEGREAQLPYFAELEQLLALAEHIEREQEPPKDLDALLPLLVQGSSIGGARPKSTILYKDRLWIAKFPSIDDEFSNARVEFATMRLASLCGIRIPDMEIIDINGKEVFFIERFDRNPLPDGTFGRTGYISGLSLLKLSDETQHYGSYVAMAEVLRHYPYPDDVNELFKRMIFNILCRNTDDHMRNFGYLIQEDETLRLSPAFDIVPSPYYAGMERVSKQAIGVGKKGKEGSLNNALSVAATFTYSREEALDVIHKMIETFSQWKEVFSSADVTEEDMDKLDFDIERRWGDKV